MSRNGKIARLPAVVREEVNQRLRVGEPGKDLVAWLNSLPKVQTTLQKHFQGYAVTEQNLSEWRMGGFEDWLDQQASLESTCTLAENSDELQLHGNGGDPRPTRYRSYAERLAVLLSVDVFEHRQTVMQKEMDPKLRWELLKELLQQVSRLRRDDHRQARLMLDQQGREREDERKAVEAKEQQVEKLRSQLEQSYWALLRWGPLVRMFGGGDLGKFFADAILRLQTGAGPVEVPEQLKAELEAFKEALAKGGATNSEQEPVSANRTESESIRVDPSRNRAETSGQTVAGQAEQPVGPLAHSIAPNRTESESIQVDQVDPTKTKVEIEQASITYPAIEAEDRRIFPAPRGHTGLRSGAAARPDGGEGEGLGVKTVLEPKAGKSTSGNPGATLGETGAIQPNPSESDLIRLNPTGSGLVHGTTAGPERPYQPWLPAPAQIYKGGNPEKQEPTPEEEELDPALVRPQGYGDMRDHPFFNHYRHMSWAQGEEVGRLPADKVKDYILKCLGDPMLRLEKIVKLGLGHEPQFDDPGKPRKPWLRFWIPTPL